MVTSESGFVLCGFLPEGFLLTAVRLLLRYGVLSNLLLSELGFNGSILRKYISLRRGYRISEQKLSTVLGLSSFSGASRSSGAPDGTQVLRNLDGPRRSLLEGKESYQRRAWLCSFVLARTLRLCANAYGPDRIATEVAGVSFLYHDGFRRLKCLLVVASRLLFLLLGARGQKLYSFEILLLRCIAVAGLRRLISAYDLITLYLALELQSFCLYILAGSKRDSEFSTEGALKYFRYGAFASGWVLYGLVLIYGAVGVVDFEGLTEVLSTVHFGDTVEAWDTMDVRLLRGIVFLRVGLLFKLTVAPFHLWAPDVYEGAPLYVTAFFAIVPKLALIALFVRLYFVVFDCAFASVTQPVLGALAGLSRVLGTLGGLYQVKRKRLRAYSAVGHRGYRVAGLACGTLGGVQAVFLYRGIYRFTSLGFFACLLRLKKLFVDDSGDDFAVETFQTHSSTQVQKRSEGSLVYLTDFVGLGESNAYLGVVVAMFFFSRAGIPPLAGFFAKYFIFFARVASEYYALALLAVIRSTVSCFYYLRVVKLMYFTGSDLSKETRTLPRLELNQANRVYCVVIALRVRFLVAFLFYSNSFLLMAKEVASFLCR